MLFLLKLICCVGNTFIIAGVVTAIIDWWSNLPIDEEKERPFYITKTYREIINGYSN